MLEMIWLADRRLMIFIILAPLVVPFAGCMSDQAAKELGETIAAPLNSIARDLSGSRDLAYATAAFQRKNGRWPKDYADLSKFVADTDGLLQLGKYDRVDFIEQLDGGLEVRSVVEGRTNQ